MSLHQARAKISMIPKIDLQIIEGMSKRIKPLIWQDDKLHAMDIDDIALEGIAFNWIKDPVLALTKLHPQDSIGEIVTFHTWAYYGFFKPTLYEVYAQIHHTVHDWERLSHFWLDQREMDGNYGSLFITGNYHWCRCRLFPSPEDA